jgi:hypothetical protein
MIGTVELFLLGAILLLIIVVAVIVRWFLNSFLAQQKSKIQIEQGKQVLALKFQAYERMVLLVERLTPESLIIREQQSGMTASSFHGHLLRIVRQEFEHNIAMQLYLTTETWERIQQLRDELLKLINSSASQVEPHAPSFELGRVILEQSSLVNNNARSTINVLRKDLNAIFK